MGSSETLRPQNSLPFRPQCPICERAVASSESRFLPFCSDRCRLIDLGRWLNEERALLNDAQSHDAQPHDAEPYDAQQEEVERPPVRLPPGWHDA